MNRIDQVRPDAPPLAQRGLYGIGVRTEVLSLLGRELTTEMWYPAQAGLPSAYPTLTRGLQPTMLWGQASRDAPELPEICTGLVIVSHGYPGNRYLLAHLCEHLASHGYRVAAADHPDSTYADQGDFWKTLAWRPRDIAALANTLSRRLPEDTPLTLVGYSMGGYGVLCASGAQPDPTALSGLGVPHTALEGLAQLPVIQNLHTTVAFGPWGGQTPCWSTDALGRVLVPTLLIAGDLDRISGYGNGIRRIWEGLPPGQRALMTFRGAGHNAGAPIPAPSESWELSPHLDFPPFLHYADAVWDSVRMNNLAQHAVLGWLRAPGQWQASHPGVTWET